MDCDQTLKTKTSQPLYAYPLKTQREKKKLKAYHRVFE